MPAATRRGLFRSTTSASATLTPLARTPARGRAAATPASYGSPVNLEESCTICFSALSNKRSAVLRPCNHRFHASCGIRWMETRESRMAQTCPLCRTRTFALEEDGDSAPLPYPFGATGQPSRVVLAKWKQPANLRWLIQETQKRLTRCEELEKSARRSEEEFAADIRDEKALLEIRRQTLTRLMGEFERGEWEEPARAAASVDELRVGSLQFAQRVQELRQRILRVQELFDGAAARAASRRNGGVQPVQPAAAAATRRVTAAAAGPARRRSRLSGVSVTPHPVPRLQQNRGHPEQTRAQATSPPRGRDADVRAVAVADAARPPPVPVPLRRSARIAAKAARAAGVMARLEM